MRCGCDLESKRCLRVFKGHSSAVTGVAFCPDGRHAISGSWDRTVRLWDGETGSCLAILKGHSDEVLSVASGADGHRALSGSRDNTVRLWDLETGHCLYVFEGHTSFVSSLAWSADQRLALSGAGDETVRLWDVERGRCLRALEGHATNVPGVAWGGDQRRALSATIRAAFGCGICPNSSPSLGLLKLPRQRCHPRGNRSNTQTPKSFLSAIPARERPDFPCDLRKTIGNRATRLLAPGPLK
jgi:WD40 repeat protein